VLHEELTVEKLQKIIDELPKEASAYKDEFVTWNEGHGH